MPRISVLMPVYNCKRYVNDAVESILNQSLSDFELIIIDDNSTDETSRIISKKNDRRIHYLRSRKHQGVAASLNIGLKVARGDYIARMDGDDIAHTDRFLIQHRYLSQHQHVGVVSSWVALLDHKGIVSGLLHYPSTHNRIQNLLFWKNCIIHPTVMMRSSLLDKYGVYDEELEGAEDYDLWLRLVRHTLFNTIPHELLYYRKRRDSVSFQRSKIMLKMSIKARIKAMKLYGYSWYHLPVLIPPIFSLLLPSSVRKLYYKHAFGYV